MSYRGIGALGVALGATPAGLRVSDPIAAKFALGSKFAFVDDPVSRGWFMTIHGAAVKGAVRVGPEPTAMDVPTWAAKTRAAGDGIVMTLVGTEVFYVPTRNIEVARTINKNDPSSVVLVEPSGGWVQGETKKTDYVLWGAGAVAALLVASVVFKKD